MFRLSAIRVLVVLVAAAGCSAAPAEPTGSSAAAVCVSSSDGSAAFDDYVSKTGGEQGAGKTKTPIFQTTSSDGNVYETQCHERRVLEFHAKSDNCNYRVLGRLLGRSRFDAKYPNGASGLQTPGEIEVASGPGMHPDFKRHWDETGGLAENGWPISGYFFEESEAEPGKRFLVQYFERAVFERHYENAPPYDVLGKLLGNFDPQCDAATPKQSVNIRMAAFIPGPKPGTSSPVCQRVDFGNFFVGGPLGGIFNTDARGFDYDAAMTRSKLAINVDLDPSANVLSNSKFSTFTERYNSAGPKLFASGDDWCRGADDSPWVDRQHANGDGIQLLDVRSLGQNADGRVGVHAKVKLSGADPLVPLTVVTPINGYCEVDTFFERGTRVPVDIYAKCEHKAFPSYELYVAGVPVMTHSGFSHSPGDLGSPLPETSTKHHCELVSDRWSCTTQ